jgi:small-conductance mechanosensitive channel
VIIVVLIETIILSIANLNPQASRGEIEATLLLGRYFFIVLGFIIILGYVGVNATAIAAITGGLSVGIGFGMQQVVSNFISGILLLFEKVLKPGDIINIEGQTSQVKKLGIRATTVQILTDNSEKIIPNQKFFTEDVTTYTGSDNLIYCSIVIGVGYHSNAQQVMNLLLDIADQHTHILKNPQPVAFFLNFDHSSLNFELKFWLDNVNRKKRVISDVNCVILDRFTQQGIEIPFPQQDIHIRNN